MAPKIPDFLEGPFSSPGGFLNLEGKTPAGWLWENTAGRVPGLLQDAAEGRAAMGWQDPLPQSKNPAQGENTKFNLDAPDPTGTSWLSGLQAYQHPQQALTPEQMAQLAGKTVPMGGSSNYSTQVVQGRPVDAPYLKASQGIADKQAKAAKQRAEAEAEAAEQSSVQVGEALKRIGTARERAVSEQDAIRQEIADREQRIDQARDELAAERVDPNRWWSTRTVPQRLSAGIAIALGGFMQGYSRGAIQNQALAMVDREVERDIALQREQIARKGDKIRGDENSLAWLYKRLGSSQEAERALRDSLNQSMGLKLQQIALTAQSPVIKANAVQMAAQLRDQFEQRRHAEVVESFDKKVKTSSSSTQRVPLLSLVQQQMKARAEDPTAIQPLTKNTVALSEVNKKIEGVNVLRKELKHFWHEYQKLGLPTGATAWWGEEGARVKNLKKILTDTYIKQKAGNVSVDMMKMFDSILADDWSNDAQVKKRIKDLLHQADVEVQTTLTTWGKHYDVTPYLRDEIATRMLQSKLYGMHYPEFRKKGSPGGAH